MKYVQHTRTIRVWLRGRGRIRLSGSAPCKQVIRKGMIHDYEKRCILTLGRTRGDKTSAPDVFGSFSFVPRAHFESGSVMVSFYGYEM